jgi:hypothetical protein
MTKEATPWDQDWLVLDNAAKIYPAVSTTGAPAVFRVSVELKSPIRVSLLAEALRLVLPRFPYFQVQLRRGFFWYYLQRHEEIPRLRPLSEEPGMGASTAQDSSFDLLLVRARENTIAVDFSHILTDGAGGVCFLGTLLCQYLALRGFRMADRSPYFDPAARPAREEYEDAHGRYFEGNMPAPPSLSSAYHMPETGAGPFRVITGRMATQAVLDLAHDRGASLTEYLAAVHIQSLATIRTREHASGRHRPGVIRLEVPVDMRRFFPSGTMRNFSLFVSPEVDLRLGEYTFEDIVDRVHHSMKIQLDPRQLRRQIARNVGAERSLLIRMMPLVAKDMMLAFAHNHLGHRAYSGVLSNLGRIELPETAKPHVREFGFVLRPTPAAKKSCSVISFSDTLKVTFSSLVRDTELERLFFRHLTSRGVKVAIVERSA